MAEEQNTSTQYRQMYGLAVSDEARELFSRREIKERAALVRTWYAKYVIDGINRKIRASSESDSDSDNTNLTA